MDKSESQDPKKSTGSLNPVKISIRVTDLGNNDTVKSLPEKVFALF